MEHFAGSALVSRKIRPAGDPEHGRPRGTLPLVRRPDGAAGYRIGGRVTQHQQAAERIGWTENGLLDEALSPIVRDVEEILEVSLRVGAGAQTGGVHVRVVDALHGLKQMS